MSQVGDGLRQVFLLDPEAEDNGVRQIQQFLKSCSDPNVRYEVPTQFSQPELRRVFFEVLGL